MSEHFRGQEVAGQRYHKVALSTYFAQAYRTLQSRGRQELSGLSTCKNLVWQRANLPIGPFYDSTNSWICPLNVKKLPRGYAGVTTAASKKSEMPSVIPSLKMLQSQIYSMSRWAQAAAPSWYNSGYWSPSPRNTCEFKGFNYMPVDSWDSYIF